MKKRKLRQKLEEARAQVRELTARHADLAATYRSTYAAYTVLRDKANDGLMSAAPQIERLQQRLEVERNGSIALQADRNRIAEQRDTALTELADMEAAYYKVCEQLRQTNRDLDALQTREAAIADAEDKVEAALHLAREMHRYASEMARSVRPNLGVKPFPAFDTVVRDYKAAKSEAEED